MTDRRGHGSGVGMKRLIPADYSGLVTQSDGKRIYIRCGTVTKVISPDGNEISCVFIDEKELAEHFQKAKA